MQEVLDYLSTTVEDGMESAKLPHREAFSVRHNKSLGARTPDLGHPYTGLGKNVPWIPLQGGCPCGSLAKGLDFHESDGASPQPNIPTCCPQSKLRDLWLTVCVSHGDTPEPGVAKTAFYKLKRHIPHLGEWGILHSTACKGDFATPRSGREQPDGG